LARRVVLATGRKGLGGPAIPDFIDRSLFPSFAAHTADEIDFSSLRGRHVAVVGAGASAWDNAAVALENGAAVVDMFARRRVLAPTPHDAVDRVLEAGDRFKLTLGCRFRAIEPEGESVRLVFGSGEDRADFVIVGTGFSVDVARSELLAPFADRIALWRDRYQ